MKTHPVDMKMPLARDIMTTRVHTLLPDSLIPIAIHQILTRRFSEMPIVNEVGEYIGMFSEKSCMRVLASLNELIDASKRAPPKAADIMVLRHNLFTLTPEDDVFVAMSELLKKGFSGAPVIDSRGRFLGVFSEKTCLGFVIEAAYSGLPSAKVSEFIDPDSNRLINVDMDLHTIAKVFIETSYGRLPVTRDLQIVGQVSRRDVLNHSEVLSSIMEYHLDESQSEPGRRLPMASTDLVAYGTLLDHNVSRFADVSSHTVDPEMNLFSIAQLFFESPHRRFPVLEGKKLIGQISRCDVLRHAITLLKQDNQRTYEGLHIVTSEEWTYFQGALESSSYMKLGPIMKWFTGNIGYHHIHHLNPHIPFYRLSEVMAAIPELQHPVVTSLRPHDILSCFRANLWENRTQRMVTYREAGSA